MIAAVKQMILCVTAASLFGTIILSLTEQKAQQEIIRIAVGIMLVLALINPIRSISFPDWSWMQSFAENTMTQAEATELYTQTVLEEFEAETEEYLEQLASRQGISCSVTVVATQEEDQIRIASADIIFPEEITDSQRQTIVQLIRQELGLSENEITQTGG